MNLKGIIGESSEAVQSLANCFKDLKPTASYIGEFLQQGTNPRKILILLALSSYDFVDKVSNRKVEGVTFICTSGFIKTNERMSGITLEKYSIATNEHKKILKSFNSVPCAVILETQRQGKNEALVQIFKVDEIAKANKNDSSLINQTGGDS